MSRVNFTVDKQEAKMIALALRLAARSQITKAHAAGLHQRGNEHSLLAEQYDFMAERAH
jgi:hypothetical protein